MVDGSEEEVVEEFGIDVRAQVAALCSSRDQMAYLLQAEGDDAFAKRVCERGVGRQVGDETFYDASHQGRFEDLDCAVDEGDELGARFAEFGAFDDLLGHLE